MMDETEMLAAFRARRAHYDTYLQANDVPLHTCPGCGFPTMTSRCDFDICLVCAWIDDGEDDQADSILDALRMPGIEISGPNRELSLKENRLNIGRMLEINADLKEGETDPDVARVINTIAFYRQRSQEIENRLTGNEHPQDHIWLEWLEIRKDMLMALVVPKDQ